MLNAVAHPLYRAALNADDAYTAIIQAVCGPTQTRWTLTTAQQRHPDILSAYLVKVAADDSWSATLRGRQ